MNIKQSWHWLWNPPVDGPQATLAIRLMTGGVFLWEGIMKFVYPSLGVVRFTKLGFADPALTAGFVGWVEIIGGILFIAGWLTRPVAIAFIIEMIVAMLSTKIGVFLGNSPLGMPASPPKMGLGAVLHDIRSDYAQIMTSIFLLVAGPGPLSLDAKAVGQTEGTGRIRTSIAAMLLVMLSIAGLHAAGSESAGESATPQVAGHFAQGKSALELKDYKSAEQELRGALISDPENADVLNMLAFSERKQGKLDEAFKDYAHALAIRPRFPEAREYLAEAHLQAALKELQTLQSYGAAGKEEAEEVSEAFKDATRKFD